MTGPRAVSAYSGRVTNWPLVWGMNVLAAGLVVVAVVVGGVLLPLIALAALVLLMNATMTSVRTTVGPRGVIVHYGVLGLPRFRYALDELSHADAVDLSARQMGGWGIHSSPRRGTRLTIRSGPALALQRRSGRPVVISAEDPAVAAALVNAGVGFTP